MDEEIERLVVSVRADVGGFAGDVTAMRASLEDGMGRGAARAGGLVEGALVRAVRTGRLEFDDLRRVAMSAMAQIAASAVSAGTGSLLRGGGGGGGGGGGLGGIFGSLVGALGLPGRATGGPVAPGRGYLVGERGPEVFVPTTSGAVQPGVGGGAREVRVAITVNAAGGGEGAALTRSARQVARAVRSAIERVD